MVTTLSAENCKTKERLIRSRKKSFFSKKVSKYHSTLKIEGYNINTQSFITNETSLKMKEKVSWKYHKLAKSIMISCLHRKKMLYEVIIIAFLRQ
jgi:hypothetical protein